MAKGAVEGLTLSLAAELAPQIRVNAIAPSLTRTPLAKNMTASDQMANAIAGLHALQRLGEPADMGELAAFLISDKAGWITGPDHRRRWRPLDAPNQGLRGCSESALIASTGHPGSSLRSVRDDTAAPGRVSEQVLKVNS